MTTNSASMVGRQVLRTCATHVDIMSGDIGKILDFLVSISHPQNGPTSATHVDTTVGCLVKTTRLYSYLLTPPQW